MKDSARAPRAGRREPVGGGAVTPPSQPRPRLPGHASASRPPGARDCRACGVSRRGHSSRPACLPPHTPPWADPQPAAARAQGSLQVRPRGWAGWKGRYYPSPGEGPLEKPGKSWDPPCPLTPPFHFHPRFTKDCWVRRLRVQITWGKE